ncbi:hypothetical protein RHMOL_Rhmol02G0236400 [Rhododendron molle]|uniref:Uncharacterized protein n=1 Tax=Rhododendron molle TaxID=49168 RepID=A0ACC0PWH0_RHOML|nr:hypothetical protein RHMOL_Rhmol02G0236400 [Rhododendron molle]
MGLVAASDSVVCPPWLRSCVGLSTVPFCGQNSACQREFAFWSGVLTDEGNSLCVFCFVVSPAIWRLDYYIGEDRFLCAAVFTSIRVLISKGIVCLDAYSTCPDPAFEYVAV